MKDGSVNTVAEVKMPPNEDDDEDDDELPAEELDLEDLSARQAISSLSKTKIRNDQRSRSLHRWFSSLSTQSRVSEFLSSGVLRFTADVPEGAAKLSLKAELEGEQGRAETTAIAYAAEAANYIQVSTSTARLLVGSFATFHVHLAREVAHVDWVVLSRDVVVATGREIAGGWIV